MEANFSEFSYGDTITEELASGKAGRFLYLSLNQQDRELFQV